MTDIQFKPGDAVQLRNGWEAEVLDVVPGQDLCVFIRYRNNSGEWFSTLRHADGRVFSNGEEPIDLVHKPKRMSGFVNVYRDGRGELFLSAIKEDREQADAHDASNRIDCIDLSERVEGQGL